MMNSKSEAASDPLTLHPEPYTLFRCCTAMCSTGRETLTGPGRWSGTSGVSLGASA